MKMLDRVKKIAFRLEAKGMAFNIAYKNLLECDEDFIKGMEKIL